jgi:hypothetical protein
VEFLKLDLFWNLATDWSFDLLCFLLKKNKNDFESDFIQEYKMKSRSETFSERLFLT